jgi:hypothetical protein
MADHRQAFSPEALNEFRERQRTMLASAHYQRAHARASRTEAIRMRTAAVLSLQTGCRVKQAGRDAMTR